MASDKTKLTELGTAVGIVDDRSVRFPDGLASLEIPGIADEIWRPVVEPAAQRAGPDRDLLARAVSNGRAFRQQVLGGRRPRIVEWSGNDRATWVSDVPRDLTVEQVWFIQAKYDSRCVLNTSPASLVDELLAEDDGATRASWYEQVAFDQLAAYYRAVLAHLHDRSLGDVELSELPDDVRDLTGVQRSLLRSRLVTHPESPEVHQAYLELCEVVSEQTARRWQRRLDAASRPRQTQMLLRMLRVAGAPYWLLGTKGAEPIRLTVTDTRTWRHRFELRRFDVRPVRAGQPRVDWRAIVRCREHAHDLTVEGYCELRWSHGKLSGNPECKVQVHTALADLPGYDPLTR